jgi:competence protein ComEA
MPAPADTPHAPADAARLDLNRATAAELDALPGIGPVLAGRIVEERTRRAGFRQVEDLRGVAGIGPKLFARLRLRVRVGPRSPAR